MRLAWLVAVAVLCAFADDFKNVKLPPLNTPRAPQVEWVRFEDPAEQAFTLEVPKGWKVVGGLYRKGVLDPRPMVDMTSPDGKINLRIGDASVPPFTTPSRSLDFRGLHEGSQYNPNGRVQGMIAKYRPGHAFADVYGQARFSTMCQHLEPKSIKDDPPTEKAGPRHPDGSEERVDAGEVVFKCDAGAPMAAFVYAETHLTQGPVAGLWVVPTLFSFIAPQDQAGAAMKMVLHALATIQPSAKWEEYQLRLIGAVNQAIMQDWNQTMRTVQTQRARMEQSSRQQQEWDDIIRGVTPTVNTVTGERREVWTGTGGPYWLTPTGKQVSSPTSPVPGAQELRPVPR